MPDPKQKGTKTPVKIKKENNKKGKKLLPEQQSSLSDALPNEVQLMILSKLEPKDLARVSRVSKKLHFLASDERMWKQLWLRDFGKHYKGSKETYKKAYKRVAMHYSPFKELTKKQKVFFLKAKQGKLTKKDFPTFIVENVTTSDLKAAIFHAVIQNDNEKLLTLLRQNPIILKLEYAFLDPFSSSIMHWAALLGHEEIIDTLIDPDIQEKGKIPKKEWEANKLKLINHCIYDFVPEENENQMYQTILFWAIRGGNINIVKKLIENGADVNFDRQEYGWTKKEPHTPLEQAISCGRSNIVKLLLQHGADAKPTIFSMAAEIPREKVGPAILEILLSHSWPWIGSTSRIGIQNEKNNALKKAVEKNQLENIKVLLKHGAKIEAISKKGEKNEIRYLLKLVKFMDKYYGKKYQDILPLLEFSQKEIATSLLRSKNRKNNLINHFKNNEKNLSFEQLNQLFEIAYSTQISNARFRGIKWHGEYIRKSPLNIALKVLRPVALKRLFTCCDKLKNLNDKIALLEKASTSPLFALPRHASKYGDTGSVKKITNKINELLHQKVKKQKPASRPSPRTR